MANVMGNCFFPLFTKELPLLNSNASLNGPYEITKDGRAEAEDVAILAPLKEFPYQRDDEKNGNTRTDNKICSLI